MRKGWDREFGCTSNTGFPDLSGGFTIMFNLGKFIKGLTYNLLIFICVTLI